MGADIREAITGARRLTSCGRAGSCRTVNEITIALPRRPCHFLPRLVAIKWEMTASCVRNCAMKLTSADRDVEGAHQPGYPNLRMRTGCSLPRGVPYRYRTD